MFHKISQSILFSVLLVALTDNPQLPDWPIEPKKDVIPFPVPKAVTVLNGEDLYVVQGDGSEQLLSSPPGVVSITEEAGPIRIRGKFVDSNGKTETRVYGGKQVFIVERVLAGQFELLKVPKGKVERRLISDGQPTPPEPPGPGPGPGPGPAPVPAKTFRVIFAVESGDTITPVQSGIMYGRAVEEWCLKNCTGGREGFARRDKDNPTISGKEMSDIWTAAKPQITKTPVAIVEKNTHVEIIPLEDSPEKMIAVFQEYLQGKRGK